MANNLTLNEKNQFLDQAGVLTLIQWIRNRGVVIEEIFAATGSEEPDYSALTDGQVYIFNNAIYKYDTSHGSTNAEHFVCLSGDAKFKQDLLATVSVGVHSLPQGEGSQTLALAGKTLDEAFDYLYSLEQDPQITQPSLAQIGFTVNVNNDDNPLVLNGGREIEAGTHITSIEYASIASKFNKGSYSFGPDTAVSITSTSVQLKKNNANQGTALTTDTDVIDTNVAQCDFVINDGDTYKLTATVNHSAGATPVTNKGNARAAMAIAAGSKTANSATISSIRAMFYGNLPAGYKGRALSQLQGSDFRHGAQNTSGYVKEKAAKKSFTITAADSSIAAMYVAVPTSLGGSLSQVLLETTQNLDITSEWQQLSVDIEGVSGSATAPYKVWVWQPATFQGNERVKVTIA